jgi:hypothetical protein
MLDNILDNIINLLPICPFIQLQNLPIDSELLSFIAWIVPFPQIIALLQAWLFAIGLWYMYKLALRRLRAIR